MHRRLRALAATGVAHLLCALVGCSGSSGGGGFGPLGDRADLPVDERVVLDGLEGPVDVVRDAFGRPHIYASSFDDALRVEGWIVARDRTAQLEILRRFAAGRLAEVLGDTDASFIDLDIALRHAGLARVAERQYAELPADLAAPLDAFADGISQVFSAIRSGALDLPEGAPDLGRDAFTSWTGSDSLAVMRLHAYLASFEGDDDTRRQLLLDSARAVFSVESGGVKLGKRAGIERDLLRFAPVDPATTASGYPAGTSGAEPPPAPAPRRVRADAASARGYLDAAAKARRLLAPEGFGSNGWVIAPARSATGYALLANDPHLPLTSPSLLYPVSIHVGVPGEPPVAEALDVSGVAIPGVPGVVLGHNARLAWGATTAGYDVTDVYAETLTAGGDAVMFRGRPVPLETIRERIEIKGRAPYTYPVKIVPHHGPIQPTITKAHEVAPLDPAAGALSVRWTGHEATTELAALFGLMRARDVDEARAALASFEVGAQSWMLADVAGSILWTSHARLPRRDVRAFRGWDRRTYEGFLPCFVLPGDGAAEWSGYLDGDAVPWERNPSAGFLASANNDPIGDTLDGDPSNDTLPDGTPMYTACSFDIGLRQGRILQRFREHADPLSPDDMAALQGDVRSPLGARLAPRLVRAIDHAEEERSSPGTHPDLARIVDDPAYHPERVRSARDLLDAWRVDSDFLAAAGVDLDTNAPLSDEGDAGPIARASAATLVFNAWYARLVARVLDDELARIDLPQDIGIDARTRVMLSLFEADPQTLATYDAATNDSALWDDLDTDVVESREERVMRALLDALEWLRENADADLEQLRWGAFHTVRFSPVFGSPAGLAIPSPSDATFPGGFPRPGDLFTVDSAGYGAVGLEADLSFSFDTGAAQRFVVDLDPHGPRAWNAVPGGNVWDPSSDHLRDQADLWRKNSTHPVPFLLPDVIEVKERRTVIAPP
jgi:penicillin G amidase